MGLNELREAFDDRIVNELAVRLESGASPIIEPKELADAMGGSHTVAQATDLLEAAVAEKLVIPVDVTWCPLRLHILGEDEIAERKCHSCDIDFRDNDDETVPGRVYRIEGDLSRDIDWVIAIHGFNTRGPWQEEFSWRLANMLKYSAPILIYKYGLVRIGVLFKRRHRTLARQLGVRIRAAIAQARESERVEVPNLVIHSFGSKLFVTLLDLPEFRDLKFGRVIAAGSVIRPDYDWTGRIEEGRLEAILNHCGGRDGAVPFAHFMIPGTGPSGKVGFSDPRTINILDPGYGHSSGLGQESLRANLGEEGVWNRFLRRPLDRFADGRQLDPADVKWRPRPFWRFVTRAGVMTFLAAVLVATLSLVAAGARTAAHWLGLW